MKKSYIYHLYYDNNNIEEFMTKQDAMKRARYLIKKEIATYLWIDRVYPNVYEWRK